MEPFNGEIIFLGTGTSEGIPRISCLTEVNAKCNVCLNSMKEGSKNRRRNTSLLIRSPHPDGRIRNIIIDVGKFFWHAALEWMVRYGIRRIDAVILTHEHFDAIGGLDDLRDFTRNAGGPIEVFLTKRDFATVSSMFPYLVTKEGVYGSRFVPDLKFTIISETEPFTVEGLEFHPLPVWHGSDYMSLGFRFGTKTVVSYVSDVSEVPPETRKKIEGCDILILDCLFIEPNFSHFSLSQSLDEIRKVMPKTALLVGMNHVLEHDAVNENLRQLISRENLFVSLAYDGQRIPMLLT